MTIRAYWFFGRTLRDGRPIPPDGEWLEHDGPVVPCKSGLHASECPFDALQYAPGEMLALVEVDGTIVRHENDKLAASRRRIIARFDATGLLHDFACKQALSVAHLWDMPAIVREYLETRDESKRDASRAAARDASRAAARDASRAAAWDAAWAAASAAAWAAASAAAWAAARDAAIGAQRKAFREAVEEKFAELTKCAS